MMRQFKVSSSITPRDSQAIARYLSDISQIEVDHSKEVELAQKSRLVVAKANRRAMSWSRQICAL